MTERTEEEKAAIRSSFAAKKRNQFIIFVLAVPAVFVIMWSSRKADSDWAGIPSSVWQTIAIVVILGSAVFSLMNWRCPACKGYLGRGLFPRFCGKCGVELS